MRIALFLTLLCLSIRAYTQQPTYGTLVAHFQGNGQQARDSLQAYRLHIKGLASEGRWEEILRTDRIDTMKTIDLSFLDIERLPQILRGADSLQKLTINDNRIRRIPGWAKHLNQLSRLEWNNNQVAGKKLKWGKLPYLTHLEIEGNQQRKLRSLKRSKLLRSISLTDNDFATVPIRALQRNDSLRVLTLNKNEQLTLGPARYDRLAALKTFKAHSCGLGSFDPSLYHMKGLTDLQLVDNQIQQIPPGIASLNQLAKLSLYKNQVGSLPAEIFQLESLEIIDLYYNQLTVIPPEINGWRSLQILYLSNNQIYDLPEELGELTGLRELYIHHNRLSGLPSTIGNLTNIHTLRIDHNYLLAFPEQILSFQKLGYLDISANDIRSLPPTLASSFPDLYLFNYQENPIDFEDQAQAYLAEMILSMMRKGVVCTPRVETETVPATIE